MPLKPIATTYQTVTIGENPRMNPNANTTPKVFPPMKQTPPLKQRIKGQAGKISLLTALAFTATAFTWPLFTLVMILGMLSSVTIAGVVYTMIECW